MEMKENTLFLTRFCGVEQYPVESATCHIVKGDGTEDDPDMLSLEIHFKTGTVLHEDTAGLEAEPSWEINFYAVQFTVSSLKPGLCLEQPNAMEDMDGNFYYVEHQPTINNQMKIIESDGERLKIHLNGATEDVNYYDGSKPKNTMELVAWFDKD
jgi:hypothetical protein